MSNTKQSYIPFVPEVDQQYVITRSVQIPSGIDRVWQAVSDADEIAHWFPNVAAQWSLEPGGTGIFTWSGHEPFPVRVEVIDEPRRIAWTWGHETDEVPTTLVEFALEEQDSTAGPVTTVTVTESGIRTPAHFAENSQGWDEELGDLVAYLAD